MTWVQVVVLGAPLLVVLLGIGVAQLKVYQATQSAQGHALRADAAALAIRVGDDAMALMRSTSGLTPASMLSWAVNEFKATAPAAVLSLGSDVSADGVQALVRRSILSSAQGGTLDDAANAVITALAPSAATAKVSPTQLAAVSLAAASAAPVTVEMVQKIIADALAPKPTVVTAATPAAPVSGPILPGQP